MRASGLAICSTILLAGCARAALPIPAEQPPGPATVSAPQLYALSSTWARPTLVAAFAMPLGVRTTPQRVLAGGRTDLRRAHGGISVDPDGTVYVFDGSHGTLETFAPRASGNARPVRVARLPRDRYTGFAPDASGNFWTAAASGQIERFPLHAAGALRPTARIAPRLDTPDGMLPASPSTVAARGDAVYCLCVVLHQGAQAIGVTQYRFSQGRARLIRSFYDFASPPLPELAPQMMHVDARSGTIYAAGVLQGYGVFAWPANQPSGVVHHRRTIYGANTGLLHVGALTTDWQGRLYAATPHGVERFAADARGNAAPETTLSNRDYLYSGIWSFGDDLAIR